MWGWRWSFVPFEETTHKQKTPRGCQVTLRGVLSLSSVLVSAFSSPWASPFFAAFRSRKGGSSSSDQAWSVAYDSEQKWWGNWVVVLKWWWWWWWWWSICSKNIVTNTVRKQSQNTITPNKVKLNNCSSFQFSKKAPSFSHSRGSVKIGEVFER